MLPFLAVNATLTPKWQAKCQLKGEMVEKTLVCCRKIDHFGVEVAFIPENWKTRIEMVLLNETVLPMIERDWK